ncbi:IS5 family transposase [Nonomuraea sp. NPDC049655]|uniref:IS5 family transposase n=1 Tax=Nonomuraea sp. NPDC049655 TaxID=3364355 RepID=UPI0037890229
MPTSTRPTPAKGGTGQDESGTRQIPRRTDQQAALATDGRGLPLAVLVTPGNVNDCTVFTQVLEQITVARPAGERPRTRPDRVIADKAYRFRAIRTHLRSRRIKATIPERADQQARRRRRGRHRGRPPAFDPAAYRRRNVVERCFNKLKQWRGIATRYDKLSRNYRAAITLVSALLWINADLPATA